jgi:hypothetical protein
VFPNFCLGELARDASICDGNFNFLRTLEVLASSLIAEKTDDIAFLIIVLCFLGGKEHSVLFELLKIHL